VEQNAFYGLFAFALIVWVSNGYPGVLPWVMGVGVAVAIDLVMRMGPVELGEMEQPGFWEWVLPSWRRRTRRF
jgi:hypothetical protein